jgi:Kdo2-lipid IVA lauroyltransferase/acyltransferase
MKRMIFATFRVAIILVFRLLGKVTFYFSKKRKPVAFENIKRCFPEKNKKEKNKILKGSFVSLGHSLADFLLIKSYKQKDIDHYIQAKNLHYFDEALQKGKGVILSTGHFGSWELAAHYLALKGFKSLILYNPIKWPEWLEVFVKKRRECCGNVLISKKRSLISLYKRIKSGGIVTLVTDQNCMPSDGIKAPLFGQNVWTHTAFIHLSLKTGAPVVPGFIFTKGLIKYEIELFKPLYPEDFTNLKNPEYQMAVASNKALESSIRRSPDHWMWQHRRFKNLSFR